MAVPATGKKQNPLWAAWWGPAVGALAVALRLADVGGRRVVFAAFAGVILAGAAAFTVRARVPARARVALMWAPVAVSLVLLVVFLVLPDPTATGPGGGCPPSGYDQFGRPCRAVSGPERGAHQWVMRVGV